MQKFKTIKLTKIDEEARSENSYVEDISNKRLMINSDLNQESGLKNILNDPNSIGHRPENNKVMINNVITKSLAFTTEESHINKANVFTIIHNYSDWLKKQALPNWVKNLVIICSDGSNIIHFDLKELQGWYHFPDVYEASLHIQEDCKYYLHYKNNFPVTKFKDVSLSKFEDDKTISFAKKVEHHGSLLKTGWPLEIHISHNKLEVYSLKSKNKDVQNIAKFLPISIQFNLLNSSKIIGQDLVSYLKQNQQSSSKFIFTEDQQSQNRKTNDVDNLCLGSKAFPETICRNFLSNLSNLQATLPEFVFKIVNV